MRLLWGLLVAVAVLPSLSGCVEFRALLSPAESTVDHVQIPDLRFGASWTMSWPLRAGGAPGMAGTGVTTDVGQSPQLILDRFGEQVAAVQLTTRENSSTHFQSTETFEVGGGNILSRFAGGSGWNSNCFGVHRTLRSPLTDYPTVAINHAVGTLMGRSLKVGDVVRQSYPQGSAFLPFTTDFTFRVVGSYRMTSAAFPDRGTLPVLVVERNQTSHWERYRGMTPGNYSSSDLWFMADGVPVPLKITEGFTADGVVGKTLLELTAYTRGRESVPFGAGPLTHQYGGILPGATLQPFGMMPPTDGLRLAFPFDAAMQAIRLDPRAAPASVWLLQHPEAYVHSAVYDRDQANQTFQWRFEFVGDNGLITAEATRRITPGLPTMDRATSSAGALFPFNWGYPAPAAVRSTRVVDPPAARDVAARLQAGAAPWRFFVVGVNGGQMGSYTEPTSVSYGFALGSVERVASTGPLTQGRIDIRDPSVAIDAATGGVARGSMDSIQCSSEFPWPV